MNSYNFQETITLLMGAVAISLPYRIWYAGLKTIPFLSEIAEAMDRGNEGLFELSRKIEDYKKSVTIFWVTILLLVFWPKLNFYGANWILGIALVINLIWTFVKFLKNPDTGSNYENKKQENLDFCGCLGLYITPVAFFFLFNSFVSGLEGKYSNRAKVDLKTEDNLVFLPEEVNLVYKSCYEEKDYLTSSGVATKRVRFLPENLVDLEVLDEGTYYLMRGMHCNSPAVARLVENLGPIKKPTRNDIVIVSNYAKQVVEIKNAQLSVPEF